MLTILALAAPLLAALGPLLTVVLGLVVIGLLWWATTMLPLPGPVKTALMIVFIIVLFVIVLRFLLHAFPELGSL